MKTLVTYFSASGVTKRVAEKVANALDADIFAIKETIDVAEYDTILIGFPVWWYTAPTIINTFIESIDISGKTAIAFCTSGGTGISGCENDLKNAYPEANWKPGKRLYGRESDDEIINWVNE